MPRKNVAQDVAPVPESSVPLDATTRQTLIALAEQTGQPLGHILAEAVEQYRRRRVLEQTNAAYAALREDPDAWRELEAERAAWDATLMDGIEDA